LDEPLGALDLKLRKDMQLELKSLQMQVGITFVYVTHDQEEALTMSDRIAVMNKGKVLQIGNPIEIYERPNCRFVADFIGDSNFLNGKVKEINSKFVKILANDLDLEIHGIPLGEMQVGQSVIASIRPEKIHLDDQPGDGLNYFQAKVINTAYIGSDTRVNVQAGLGLVLKIWEQNKFSTIDPKAYYKNGEVVWVQLIPENTLILPGEN
jgi:spermidine/putrescine transport system ATP-binding protein